jgi:endonuclease/exonuclease/phosphatase family metal-dependent hydrolase
VAIEGKGLGDRKPPEFKSPEGEAEYFLAFWNLENLFDDVNDGRGKRGDEVYDPYFADNAEALKQKLHNLASILVKMNGGKGPDILCCAEVESERAAQLLVQAVNARLADPKLHYTSILFEDVGGGRDIGTPIITRLPVEPKRGKLIGRRMRILEGQVVVNGHPLVLVVSHWSSRISDKTGATRAKYADQVYGRFLGMYKANPAVDFLACGDFNDDPTDDSVAKNLRATGNIDDVKKPGEWPSLYHCLAGLADGRTGTMYYRKWHLFDHICVSPGMLDKKGWSIVPGSGAIVQEPADRNGRPLRFGGPSDKTALSLRGASDHFAVTVKLRVAARDK